MKWIKYQVNNPVNIGTEENPIMQDNLFGLKVPYSDEGLAIAKAEAYNGIYEIYDDGIEEIQEPTQLDRIEAQITYTAMMTNTLLED
jgi:hypothetical protein